MAAFKSIIKENIDIRLQPARLIPLGLQDSGYYSEKPDNGASISTLDHPETQQTIGIFVNIRVDQGYPCPPGLSVGDNPCTIVCHHGIAPQHDSQIWAAAWENGISSADTTDDRMHQRILYPGRPDLRASVAVLRNDVERAQTYTEALEVYPCTPQMEAEMSSMKACIKEMVKQAAKLNQVIHQKNTLIGRVITSSGVYVCKSVACSFGTDEQVGPWCKSDHHLRDIAVIRLEPE